MLIAFSLVAISLSYLLFNHPPSTWPALLRPPKLPPAVRKPSQTPADAPHQPDDRNPTPASNHSSPATTPKATPTQNTDDVPTFTLAAHESSDEDDDDNLPPPSFPALNSAQRASAPSPTISMAPPPKPTLMAPPRNPHPLRSCPLPRSKPRISALSPPRHSPSAYPPQVLCPTAAPYPTAALPPPPAVSCPPRPSKRPTPVAAPSVPQTITTHHPTPQIHPPTSLLPAHPLLLVITTSSSPLPYPSLSPPFFPPVLTAAVTLASTPVPSPVLALPTSSIVAVTAVPLALTVSSV
ncbi:hypothetical protein GRF29_1g3356313 [Pseudopithomyces chartarum]|uniref:Uncharacterized protein n=1 Tax=Pseudopithomyces chartarum TaxID=1892770 RepID=A0AAN6RMK4_9PLEO|nr:hypothetical protein GRF29_1g3356313 [Pseudopithomyces chartarum]